MAGAGPLARLTNGLPEETRHGRLPGETAKQLARASFGALWELIDPNDRPALRFSDGRSQFISHRNLHDFVRGFRLSTEARSSPTLTGRPVVCVALPNGPLLAAVCVAVATYYVAAPINPAVGPDQFRADVSRVGASFILTTASDVDALQLGDAWVRDGGIRVLVAQLEQDMTITVREVGGNIPLHLEPGPQPRPNKGDDVSIVLFTSGTTGTKKVVPLMMHSILAGVAQVISSWALTNQDTCLNMMPLYHVSVSPIPDWMLTLLTVSVEGWSGIFSRQSSPAGRSCASPFSTPANFGTWLGRINSGRHGIMPRRLCIQ
jgi:acyl-coenzyme A synthetase/AMP-(fatty) acid ligase